MSDLSVIRELKEYENEKKIDEKVLNAEKLKISMMLKGEMGQDMKDVLEGKKKVQLSKKEIIKYKIKFYWEKFIKTIDKIFATF